MDGLSASDIVVNGGYLTSLLALTVRDVLRLRVLLLASQGLFLSWGILLALKATVVWNVLFIVINTAMIARILWERRPISIPEAFADIHDHLFPSMSPRDFLLFLELGNPHRLESGTLVHEGDHPDALKLILDGEAGVYRGGKHVTDIGRGSFVAEMSMLTGRAASADVRTDSGVAFLSWSRRKLEALATLNPHLYLELHRALGRDVSAKASANTDREHAATHADAHAEALDDTGHGDPTLGAAPAAPERDA